MTEYSNARWTLTSDGNTPPQNQVVSDEHDDDSSGSEAEIDVGGYEKRRETNLRRLLVLEKQFNKLREELYRERLHQVDRRQSELLNRVASDYLRKMAMLDAEQERRLEMCETIRRFQLDELERVYLGVVVAVHKDNENDRALLYDRVQSEINAQIDALKAEKLNADVSLALWMDSYRNKDKLTKKKAFKHRPISTIGPYIVYLARPEDVDDDWRAIRKATIEADIRDRMQQQSS